MGPAFPSRLGPGAVWVLCVWVEFVRLAEFRIACALICGAKVPLFCTPTNPYKKRSVLTGVEPKCGCVCFASLYRTCPSVRGVYR